jgi:hydrogenase expression/formation protein HypE
MGAEPVAILDSVMVEEGYKMSDLRALVRSMNETALEADVAIISGDFKVMPRGHLDGVVIATCSIGILRDGRRILDSGARSGDKVIVTGSVGDHGIALMSAREGLEFEAELKSDVAPIWSTVKAALDAGEVTAMKDPTRGGLSAALNEISEKSGVSIWMDEDKVPIKESVKAASEMLGLDPYEVTCEGRAVICVSSETADGVLEAVRKTKYGEGAAIIGEVMRTRPGLVLLRTLVGGTRILRKPLGEPIPRVC